MSQHDVIATAREFVLAAELPPAPPVLESVSREAGLEAAQPSLALAPQAGTSQAAVVGAELVTFVPEVTAEQRSDIVQALILAQLVAKKAAPSPTKMSDVVAWYESYFDTLSRIGFAVVDRGFSEHVEKGDDFAAHEALLGLATTLLAGAPGALLLVKSTLEALQQMAKDTPWITLFHRESQSFQTAHFHVSAVTVGPGGQLETSVAAFALEANSDLTQVLFFKFRKNEVRLRSHMGKVSVHTATLGGVRGAIAQKIAAHADGFVASLPDL